MGTHFSFNHSLVVLLWGVGCGQKAMKSQSLPLQEQYGSVSFSATSNAAELRWAQIWAAWDSARESEILHGKNLLSALRSFQVLEEFMVRRTWCATAVNTYRRPEETEGGQKMEQRCCGFMDRASFFLWGFWCVWRCSGEHHVFQLWVRLLFAQIPLHPVLNKSPTCDHRASDSLYIINEREKSNSRECFILCALLELFFTT